MHSRDQFCIINSLWDISIIQLSRWQPATVLDYSEVKFLTAVHWATLCISMPNLPEICHAAAEISQIFRVFFQVQCEKSLDDRA